MIYAFARCYVINDQCMEPVLPARCQIIWSHERPVPTISFLPVMASRIARHVLPRVRAGASLTRGNISASAFRAGKRFNSSTSHATAGTSDRPWQVSTKLSYWVYSQINLMRKRIDWFGLDFWASGESRHISLNPWTEADAGNLVHLLGWLQWQL